MNRNLILGMTLALSTTMFGCGSVGALLNPDGGTVTQPDMALQIYKLQSGTYVVTALTIGTDGCMVDPNSVASPTIGKTFTLTNDGSPNYNITLGSPGGTPMQPSNGANCPGVPANAACASAMNPMPFNNNVGTLVRDNNIDDGQGCSEHRHIENLLTLTADNTFTAAYTRTDSNMMGCALKATCTTTWTWSFTKQ